MKLLFRDVTDENRLLRRLVITIATIIGARLLYFIPVPGVQLGTLQLIYEQHILAQGGGLLDLLTLLHGGRLRSMSLFALGILPYVNACVIAQLILFLVPGLQTRWFGRGTGGRNRLFAFTVILALILSGVHAYRMSINLELLNSVPGLNMLNFTGLAFRVSTTCAMSAAVLLLIFWSEVINRIGIGNGVGVIVVSEVIVRIFLAMHQLGLYAQRKALSWAQLSAFIIFVIVFLWIIWFVSRQEIKLPCKTHAGTNVALSVRPEWVGVWPVIMAEAVISVFSVTLTWVTALSIAVVIVFFSLLLFKIVYQPRRFYELLLGHRCEAVLPKGRRLEDMLNQAVLRCISLSIALFLTIYFLPVVMPFLFDISFVSAGIFGAFGLIIILGVGDDINAQWEFFRRLGRHPTQEWKVVRIASEEAQAVIQQACLQSHGIIAEVKPSHFVWGLPMGTVASKYSVYVPEQQKVEAKKLLESLYQKRRSRAI